MNAIRTIIWYIAIFPCFLVVCEVDNEIDSSPSATTVNDFVEPQLRGSTDFTSDGTKEISDTILGDNAHTSTDVDLTSEPIVHRSNVDEAIKDHISQLKTRMKQNMGGLPAEMRDPITDIDDSWLLKFNKVADVNPILGPLSNTMWTCPIRQEVVKWEEKDVFNPAAVVKDGKVFVLYRAEDKVNFSKLIHLFSSFTKLKM